MEMIVRLRFFYKLSVMSDAMATATSRLDDQPARHGRTLLTLTIAALLPAFGYFVTAMLGLLFDNLRPVRWLAEELSDLAGAWSIPLLLMLAIGGPVLGVMGSLVLGIENRSTARLHSLCGGIAVALVVLNVLLTLFFLPFAFDN
jgi:hypothetical protein